MAHIGNGVEYALHCLLWLVDADSRALSCRELAEMQGVSPTFLAKIFPKLEKAGLVSAAEGVRGGYQLARAARDITVLDVVDAVEGGKSLFDCQQVRERCAMFDGAAPRWAKAGVCGIHAVMLRAEQSMRVELRKTSLADLAAGVHSKMPAKFPAEVDVWFEARIQKRLEAKSSASPKSRASAAPLRGAPRGGRPKGAA